MAFKKYQGRGFTLVIEGPAGEDGRKRETTYISCRAQDFDDVLSVVLEGEDWEEMGEKLVPPDYVRKFARPSKGKKDFTILVKRSDYLRTVFWVPDQETSEASLMPGPDARKFLD